MIHIEVTGKANYLFKQTLVSACRFYMVQLGFRKRKTPLDITIKITKKMSVHGLCEFNQDFKYPEIEIHLNKDTGEDEMVKTLGHELVHAKQFLRKELTFKNKIFYWKGQLSENEEWEDEAYELEEKLYGEYVKWK